MSAVDSLPAPNLTAPEDGKWREEQRAFRRLLPDLLRTHRDLYVAIHEGRAVGLGVDKLEVARAAYEQFGYIPIFVSRVTESQIPTIRIPSPRRGG